MTSWPRFHVALPLIEEFARRQEIAVAVYPYLAGATVVREDHCAPTQHDWLRWVGIKDLATYDDPTHPSEGIKAVYVNGVFADSQASGTQLLARAGRMLKRGG